jgi:uncharacterized Fe-S cluster-containing MiaB family protein
VEVIRALVELGAALEAKTDDGLTPLNCAVEYGPHREAERVLKELLAARGAAASQTSTTCAACGYASGTSGAALKKCSRCKSVKYCSEACQRTHWRVHKPSCAAAAGPSAS